MPCHALLVGHTIPCVLCVGFALQQYRFCWAIFPRNSGDVPQTRAVARNQIFVICLTKIAGGRARCNATETATPSPNRAHLTKGGSSLCCAATLDCPVAGERGFLGVSPLCHHMSPPVTKCVTSAVPRGVQSPRRHPQVPSPQPRRAKTPFSGVVRLVAPVLR